MKAKLIKRSEIKKSSHRKARAKDASPTMKTTTEVVRGWIGEHQKAQQSARKSFTALFSEPRLRRA